MLCTLVDTRPTMMPSYFTRVSISVLQALSLHHTECMVHLLTATLALADSSTMISGLMASQR
jgi:hypothetical protein